MQFAIVALFLIAILALLFQPVQLVLEKWLRPRPRLLLIFPILLAAVFIWTLWVAGALVWPLAAAIAVYTFVPALAALSQGTRSPSWMDGFVILFLWLPLEFPGLVAGLVPRPAQGFVHSVAYGIAILLTLVVFLVYRQFPGMKYRLLQSPRDLTRPLAAFVLAAPVLIVLGLAISFMEPFHAPRMSPATIAARFLLILVATALPEEILFRGLIQNWLMQRLGQTTRVLLLASLIFGAAHLNNSPGPPPNWRYMVMATIAGFAYGKVFQNSSSVVSSAILHALVNTTKHAVF